MWPLRDLSLFSFDYEHCTTVVITITSPLLLAAPLPASQLPPCISCFMAERKNLLRALYGPTNLELAGDRSLCGVLLCPGGRGFARKEGEAFLCPSGIRTWRAPFFDSHWALHSPPQTKGLFFSTQRKIPVFLNLMLYLCPNSLNYPRVLAFGMKKKKKKSRDTESSFCFKPCHTLPLRPWTQAINLLDSGMRAVW